MNPEPYLWHQRFDELSYDSEYERLLKCFTWGYVTAEKCVVITGSFHRNLQLRTELERDLGVIVFNRKDDLSCKAYAKDSEGRRVAWASVRDLWFLYDDEHKIILPEPYWWRHIVYPAPTARPHMLVRRPNASAAIVHSVPDRKRYNVLMDFMNLVRLRGVVAGKIGNQPFEQAMRNVLAAYPIPENVCLEDAASIVHSPTGEDRWKRVKQYVSDYSRHEYETEYLSTWRNHEE